MPRLTQNVIRQLLAAAKFYHDHRESMAFLSRDERSHLDRGIEWLEAKQRDKAEA